MSDVKLKIRHAKRGNEKAIDLSGMGLTEIPADIGQLTSLEVINLSGNRLTNLRGIEDLQSLTSINAANNKIAQLHTEIMDLYTLESLNLIGNPIVNQNPQLAKIDGNEIAVQEAFNQYFASSSSFGSANAMSSANLGISPVDQQPTSQSQRVNHQGLRQGMDSFKSDNSGGGSGFLARAQAADNQNMGSSMRVTNQFDSLQVSSGMPAMQ